MLGVSLPVCVYSTWSTFCVNRVRKVEQPQHKQCSTSDTFLPMESFFFFNCNFSVCCLVTRLELSEEFPPPHQEVCTRPSWPLTKQRRQEQQYLLKQNKTKQKWHFFWLLPTGGAVVVECLSSMKMNKSFPTA